MIPIITMDSLDVCHTIKSFLNPFDEAKYLSGQLDIPLETFIFPHNINILYYASLEEFIFCHNTYREEIDKFVKFQYHQCGNRFGSGTKPYDINYFHCLCSLNNNNLPLFYHFWKDQDFQNKKDESCFLHMARFMLYSSMPLTEIIDIIKSFGSLEEDTLTNFYEKLCSYTDIDNNFITKLLSLWEEKVLPIPNINSLLGIYSIITVTSSSVDILSKFIPYISSLKLSQELSNKDLSYMFLRATSGLNKMDRQKFIYLCQEFELTMDDFMEIVRDGKLGPFFNRDDWMGYFTSSHPKNLWETENQIKLVEDMKKELSFSNSNFGRYLTPENLKKIARNINCKNNKIYKGLITSLFNIYDDSSYVKSNKLNPDIPPSYYLEMMQYYYPKDTEDSKEDNQKKTTIAHQFFLLYIQAQKEQEHGKVKI